jgi:hypothetical protein
MQEDERDLLEIRIFDEMEETVGTWLRGIIQRLEKEQADIGSTRAADPKPRNLERKAPALPEAPFEGCKVPSATALGGRQTCLQRCRRTRFRALQVDRAVDTA